VAGCGSCSGGSKVGYIGNDTAYAPDLDAITVGAG